MTSQTNEKLMNILTKNIASGSAPLPLTVYRERGGYAALSKALFTMTPEEVCEEVTRSGLRGLGGAGFPTGNKWSFMRKLQGDAGERFVVMNADEMEPGAFKDRLLLEGDPHELLEGLLIAAYALEATTAWIFLRQEYTLAEMRLRAAIAEATAAGCIGDHILGSHKSIRVRLHLSAGRYMCGEETGLLNALEGGRAQPRHKPPFPQVVGLFGRPTVVNNAETIAWLPHIVQNGADWFRTLGRNGSCGMKLYGASGRVNRPGIFELPMGATAREVIETHAGGMREGCRLRAFLPGGASTDFLTGQHLDIPLDFDSLQRAGSRLGTGTLILLDDHTCPVGMVRAIEAFFARESCGWCTPCRDGLPWIQSILDDLENGRGAKGDLERLELLGRRLAPGSTFCAFAPGAAAPLLSALKLFREDFERHITERKCPWKQAER
jgi:NADH-quinone oxidoreductase subunit F